MGTRSYLAAVATWVDMGYADRQPAAVTGEEEMGLLAQFRSAPSEVRTAILRALGIILIPSLPGKVWITGGELGQVIAGSVQQRDVSALRSETYIAPPVQPFYTAFDLDLGIKPAL